VGALKGEDLQNGEKNKVDAESISIIGLFMG